MRKLFFIALLFFFALTQVTTAFAQSGTKTKSIKLTWSDHAPPTAEGNLFFKQEWLPRINKQIAPKYKLDITFYHASSLYKYLDQVQALEDGLIDFTTMVVSWEQARIPLYEVLSLPLMGWDAISSNRIWFELQENIPEFEAQFSKRYKELFHFQALPRMLNFKNKVPRVPADYEGIRILASGALGDLFKSLGAVPIRQHPSDWYTSIERGLVDGVAVGIVMITMFKLQEVVNIHISFGGDSFGLTGVPFVMNRKKFESLPPEVKKAINDNIKWASERITLREHKKNPKSEAVCLKAGAKIIQLTPDEIEKWRAVVEPINEKWVANLEAKGQPARKVYKEAKRLVNKYHK